MMLVQTKTSTTTTTTMKTMILSLCQTGVEGFTCVRMQAPRCRYVSSFRHTTVTYVISKNVLAPLLRYLTLTIDTWQWRSDLLFYKNSFRDIREFTYYLLLYEQKFMELTRPS